MRLAEFVQEVQTCYPILKGIENSANDPPGIPWAILLSSSRIAMNGRD
jgi:hypothetical protein